MHSAEESLGVSTRNFEIIHYHDLKNYMIKILRVSCIIIDINNFKSTILDCKFRLSKYIIGIVFKDLNAESSTTQ